MGADGLDGVPLDGADGAPGDQYSGLGGKAGANGHADASGSTVGDSEIWPDGTPLLAYTWIHNQAADLDIVGAGGGGDGGTGTGIIDTLTPKVWEPGRGGLGGDGDGAIATVACTQTSDVNLQATAIVNPNWPQQDPLPPEVAGSIEFMIGWVSAPNPDWYNAGADAWARSINMAIVAGNSSVNIVGGPTGVISAWGSDDLGNPFFKTSTDVMESDTGSFGIGPGELGITNLTAGQTASITVAPGSPISSVLGGGNFMSGGQGGGDADDDGANGGAGGANGIDLGSFDTNADGIPDLFIVGGGHGMDGSDGDSYLEHKDGIYEGYAIVRLGDGP
jgi:hypothetical protein